MLRRNMDLVLSLPFAAPSAAVFARSKLPQAAELLTLGNHHHHAIVEAIERREGTRAEGVAREHARLGRRNLEVALADQSILSCMPGAPLVLLPASAGVQAEANA
jgi:GntR family transcriptional regulator of vanillate catabolism